MRPLPKKLAVGLLAVGLAGLVPSGCRPNAEQKASVAPISAPSERRASGPADDTLYAFEQDDKFGFKNRRGRVRIPARYQMAFTDTFDRQIAFVVSANAVVAIDRQERRVLTPFIFDNGPDYLSSGLFRFVENGKMGFADADGRKLIPARFDFAAPFAGNRAAFCVGCRQVPDGEHHRLEGGTWGYLDKQGRVAIAPAYAWASPFDSARAEVTLGSRELAIDTTGKVVSRAAR